MEIFGGVDVGENIKSFGFWIFGCLKLDCKFGLFIEYLSVNIKLVV